MAERPFILIGELINNSFARPRRAWINRDLAAYQNLARLQADLGADFLDVNIDATQIVPVRMEAMLEFLPKLVPALQEATSTPLCFDQPSYEYQEMALRHYDRSKSGAPIINSIAASRENLEGLIDLVAKYDTRIIVMASEHFIDGESEPCHGGQEVYESAKYFVNLLREKAGRTNDQIFLDPGLAPIGADTYGLINTGLDGMRLISQDPDLKGVHMSVGLTNFSFGIPKEIRVNLESAYITVGMEAGLDCAIASAEKSYKILDPSDPTLIKVKEALAEGRPMDGESQDDAGIRQTMKIMELYA